MFEKIDIKSIDKSPVQMIGFDWMLLSAGNPDSFNCMTASWGGLGYMWNNPAAFIFVRPNRHTFSFLEKCEDFTISFFGGEYREALKICGSKSGRYTNKVSESGLTPWFTPMQNPAFEEAKYVFECGKAYAQSLEASDFIDKSALDKWYSESNPIHKMYIGTIKAAYARVDAL